MEHKGTVRLETKRLVLRQFTPDDLEEIFTNSWSDMDVWKFTRYAPMKCIDDVRNNANMFTESWFAAYERLNRYSWAIELKETGEVIGRYFGMHPNDELQSVELAYELGKKWWNQGLMTEATKAIIAFFIEDVGMNIVYADHSSDNPASGRVMQKSGMKYQATHKQAMKDNHGVSDEIVYAVQRCVFERNSENCTKAHLAQIAREKAALPLHGFLPNEESNIHPIVSLFPKWSLKAADGLWCAGFVYYCCIEAGFEIPYKPVECAESGTLAGCGSWEVFAITNPRINFYRNDPSFQPESGDIVLYDNVFCGVEHDHIGIVLKADEEKITVAEGNVDNVSAIMVRPRDEHIRAYIRIPDGYSYLE